jgi:hypothetical protein
MGDANLKVIAAELITKFRTNVTINYAGKNRRHREAHPNKCVFMAQPGVMR